MGEVELIAVADVAAANLGEIGAEQRHRERVALQLAHGGFEVGLAAVHAEVHQQVGAGVAG